MEQKITLFDQFVRTDSKPASYTEPMFESFNRLAWKNMGVIRDTLEKWFNEYPNECNLELRRRFRSKDNLEHKGAFFELVLFQFLTEMGLKVQVNPKLKNGRPDFFVETQTGECAYVEATISSPNTFQDSPTELVFFDELNKLHCPDFWLHIPSTRGKLNQTPPLKKTMRNIQTWIDGLNYENAKSMWESRKQLPEYEYRYLDWVIRIEAMPKGQASRGKPHHRPIGIGPIRMEWVNSIKPISSAIHEKASKYRGVGSPFVIAVSALDPVGIEKREIVEALFGYEESTEDATKSIITPLNGKRNKDNAWSPKKNRGISGLILFDDLHHANLANANVYFVENPWATYQSPRVFRRLPHGLVQDDFLKWYPGEKLRMILGLPETWPGAK